MKIDKNVHEDYAVLTLKGEFDTYYCPLLQEEVEGLVEQGISHLLLDMRLVKFINSTALGAIIKAHKRCKAEGGEMVISSASNFVRDVMGKVGIDRLVPVFENEADATKAIVKALNSRELAGQAPVDQEKVMITFPDDVRNQMIGGKKVLLGTMSNVDGTQVTFQWNGSKQGVNQGQAEQLFYAGSQLDLKFQVRMIKKGFFEIPAKVATVEKSSDGGVRVSAAFTRIGESDRSALNQFAEDMAFLKRQLPGS